MDYLATHTSLSPIWRGFAPGKKKGALDSQPQVIKFTSCLPMVGGSLRELRLLPPLKLVAKIYARVGILLTFRKHLYVPNHESDWLCICALGISILSQFLRFWNDYFILIDI